MATEASPAEEAETLDTDALISGIREALGIKLHPSPNPIANEREHGMIATLERLTDEQLSIVLSISRRARQLSVLDGERADRHGIYRAPDEPHTGQDCFKVRELLFKGELSDLFLLAPVLDSMPPKMSIRSALACVRVLNNEMFDVTSVVHLSAHLRFFNALHPKLRYSPQRIVIVHLHPDKTDTIISLMNNGNLSPSNRDVIIHHGVTPVLYDGVI
jgi:hypothetical protein